MALLHASSYRDFGFGRGLSDLFIGLIAGCALVGGFSVDPKLGIAVAGLIVVLPILVLWPSSVFFLAILGILVFEEFPSGLGAVDARSLRMPFYAKSIAVPGLYLPDVMLLAAIGLAVLNLLIQRRRLDLPLDRSATWLLLLSAVLVISVGLPFIRGNPLHFGGFESSIDFGFDINVRGAELIAFFQFKNFVLLMLAYLATVLHVRDLTAINRCVQVVGVAALIYVGIGAYRLGTHPEWIAQTIPLFYDSVSSLLFVLIAYYVVAAWSQGMLSNAHTLWLSVLAGIMIVFVLVSFRRTMWGAMVLAVLPLIWFMPASRRNFLIVLGIAVAFVLGGAVLLSPVGEKLIDAISRRLSETTKEDGSTLYRMALFRFFSEHFTNLPWFGYGPKPLWNEMIKVDVRELPLENVHSLFFWLWLRLGHVGFVVFVVGITMIMAQAWAIARNAWDPRHRVLALMILLGILMFLFSGIFNPVYGQPRYLILVGLGLGLLTRIVQHHKRLTVRAEA